MQAEKHPCVRVFLLFKGTNAASPEQVCDKCTQTLSTASGYPLYALAAAQHPLVLSVSLLNDTLEAGVIFETLEEGLIHYGY